MSERSRSAVLISIVVVSLLMAATAGAIVLTQHLRDEGPVVSSIYWKTRPGPRYKICFLLARDDHVKVAVVDFDDRQVRIARRRGARRGRDAAHCFDWDARTSSGQPAPPGPYFLQVTLDRAGRTAVSGEHVTIHAAGGQP